MIRKERPPPAGRNAVLERHLLEMERICKRVLDGHAGMVPYIKAEARAGKRLLSGLVQVHSERLEETFDRIISNTSAPRDFAELALDLVSQLRAEAVAGEGFSPTLSAA